VRTRREAPGELGEDVGGLCVVVLTNVVAAKIVERVFGELLSRVLIDEGLRRRSPVLLHRDDA
jgi:hypothetical protein